MAGRAPLMLLLLAMATPLSSALVPGAETHRACEESNYYLSNDPCVHTAGHGGAVTCLAYLNPLNSGSHVVDNCVHL